MSTNTEDDSFHPLGPEWEEQLEAMLEDTEYDTELGLAMAEDAQRLVAGEMTEAEFHEKYHADVLEEFGEDERPTADAWEDSQRGDGVFGTLSSVDDGEESRRSVMKKMGVGAGALGVGAFGATQDAPGGSGGGTASADRDDNPRQWGMTIDLEVCDGCLSCMTACSEENNLDSGVNWMYVLAWEDSNTDSPVPDEDWFGGDDVRDFNYLVRPCQHCSDAPCEKVCPTTARHTRRKDGLVLTDYDICIGCRYCQVACPYGVNYFQWEEPTVSESAIADAADHGDHIHADGRPVDSRAPRGVMSKCTMCPTRQDGDHGDQSVGTTACMDACPPGAIQFGDVTDEASNPSIYAEHPVVGRALEDEITGDLPPADDLADDLDGDDLTIDDVVDGDNEMSQMLIEMVQAIDLLMEDLDIDPDDETPGAFGPLIGQVRDVSDVLRDHGVDIGSGAVLEELGFVSDGDDFSEREVRNGAERILGSYKGTHVSDFKLLENYGTNPNITYIGNEPGPQAEQVDHWISIDDFSYTGADGSEIDLVDNRKDVLDERTFGGGLGP